MIKYIISGCFAVLIAFSYMHGQAKYKQGFADAGKVCADNKAQAAKSANKVLEKMKKDAASMDIDAIDAGLLSLGIVRRSDR